MDKFLTFGVTGLALAAIYAVIASGLVLTYTTTGIFNFAHGATGMLAAFCYWQVRFAWGWPAPVALVFVLFVLAPAFGALLERFVMRGLYETSETVRLVVTIALMTAMIGLARWIWDPSVGRPLSRFFASTEPIRIGSTAITWHELVTIITAAVVAGGLWALLHRTRTGIAMRAGVDDRALSVLNGADPHRSARTAWMLGTGLAAVGGILIAPNVALDAGSLSLLIVSAYAAAIFGRLRSLPLTFVGALIVGCTESYLTGYLPTNQYLPGLRLAAPALILLLVLLVIPNPRLKGRTRTREHFPMPTWTGSYAFALGTLALAVVLATTLAETDLLEYAKIFPIAIIGLSFVVLVGFAGQISLCQLSLAGIGALTAAQLGAQGQVTGLIGAALVAGLVGAIIALPALRLSGIYLALATAAFAIVLDRWIFTMPDFAVFGLFDVHLFNQSSADVAPLSVFGYTFESSQSQMILSAAVFSLLALVVVGVRRGRFGRRLLAVRDSEAAVATLGGDILATKVIVFAASSAIAGIGGALYAMQLQSVDANTFDLVAGLPILVLAVVGGISTVGGALFAGLAFAGVLSVMVVLFPSLENVALILPGTVGVALGRNPNGMVADIRVALKPVTDRPVAWGAGVAVFLVSYGLRLLDVIDNWMFVIAAGASFVLAIAVARYLAAKERPPVEPEVPVEWRGITRPWLPSDRIELNAVLGISNRGGDDA